MNGPEQKCNGKVRHASEGEAWTAADKMAAKTGDAFEAYRCEFCHGCHVGHAKLKPIVEKEMEYEYEQNEGQVIETDVPDVTALAMLNKSEIDQQVATAKRYPRSITAFRREATQLITLDEQTAAECIYALPRDGKTIEGPSARFAEVMAYSWGNCRAGARVVGEDDEFVTAQGMFYDLEKNVAYSYEVKRRITDKHGRRFKADMVGVTSNAASSIALRNAVLKGIPKALWKPLYNAAKKTIMGDLKTLTTRREEKVALFKAFGVTPQMIFRVLSVEGMQDVTLEHLVTLQGMFTALQEGDTTPEEMFKTEAQRTSEHVADATATKTAGLADKYVKKEAPITGPQPVVDNLDSEPPVEGYDADPTSPAVGETAPPPEDKKSRGKSSSAAPTGKQLFGSQG